MCLWNRYGKPILDCLRQPEWSCPVCRDVCNCAACLRGRKEAHTFVLQVELPDLYSELSVDDIGAQSMAGISDFRPRSRSGKSDNKKRKKENSPLLAVLGDMNSTKSSEGSSPSWQGSLVLVKRVGLPIWPAHEIPKQSSYLMHPSPARSTRDHVSVRYFGDLQTDWVTKDEVIPFSKDTLCSERDKVWALDIHKRYEQASLEALETLHSEPQEKPDSSRQSMLENGIQNKKRRQSDEDNTNNIITNKRADEKSTAAPPHQAQNQQEQCEQTRQYDNTGDFQNSNQQEKQKLEDQQHQPFANGCSSFEDPAA